MNNKRNLTIASIALFLLAVYAILIGNETILPTALVLLFLCLIRSISPTPSAPNGSKPSTPEKAAQSAIASFAILVAILSVLTSLYLPGIAAAYGLTGLFDGDFVRVTINDAHELAYTTCLLLIFDMLFLAWYRRKPSWELHPEQHPGLNRPV